MQTGSPRFFSPDYVTARSRFLDFADAAGARLFAFPVTGKGPSGELLTIDVASFGPSEPERVLFLNSGLHGPEGFAGSAAQLQFITHQLKAALSVSGTGIVIIHASNPHGMAHWERSNGNNVDLNRNFCDHPDGQIPNPAYRELDRYINPERIGGAADDECREAMRAFAARHGLHGLQSAIASGQYEFPRGLYYGGTRPEESNLHLRQIAKIFTSSAHRAVWIDFHTGLGESGEVSLITDLPAGSPLYERIRRWYGDLTESTSEADGTSTVTNGSLDIAILGQFPKTCEGTLVTAEFGTFGTSRIFWALRARNWLKHHGSAESDTGRSIIRESFEVFNPPDDGWRTRVLNNAASVIEMTLTGLAGEPGVRA